MMAAVAERRRSWDALMDGVHLMKALTRVQRQQLSCLLETKECEVGEVLGAEDEPGDRMWMVLQARLFFFTLVPVRPRSRGERRSLRTFPGVSLRPPLAFNPRHRRLSTPTDAFQLHPDIRSYRTALILIVFRIAVWCPRSPRSAPRERRARRSATWTVA